MRGKTGGKDVYEKRYPRWSLISVPETVPRERDLSFGVPHVLELTMDGGTTPILVSKNKVFEP